MIQIHSSDRMDRLIALAVRSGFNVRQTPTGTWLFRKGIMTLSFYRTPRSSGEWVDMVKTLKGAGVDIPGADNGDQDED